MGPMLLAMDEAGKAYRRALELAPDDSEITLRLARVALERNRLDEAERVLAPLLPDPCRDATCGLAHLFAGELHEARHDLERRRARMRVRRACRQCGRPRWSR